jgi:hypothetical protein
MRSREIPTRFCIPLSIAPRPAGTVKASEKMTVVPAGGGADGAAGLLPLHAGRTTATATAHIAARLLDVMLMSFPSGAKMRPR